MIEFYAAMFDIRIEEEKAWVFDQLEHNWLPLLDVTTYITARTKRKRKDERLEHEVNMCPGHNDYNIRKEKFSKMEYCTPKCEQ